MPPATPSAPSSPLWSANMVTMGEPAPCTIQPPGTHTMQPRSPTATDSQPPGMVETLWLPQAAAAAPRRSTTSIPVSVGGGVTAEPPPVPSPPEPPAPEPSSPHAASARSKSGSTPRGRGFMPGRRACRVPLSRVARVSPPSRAASRSSENRCSFIGRSRETRRCVRHVQRRLRKRCVGRGTEVHGFRRRARGERRGRPWRSAATRSHRAP